MANTKRKKDIRTASFDNRNQAHEHAIEEQEIVAARHQATLQAIKSALDLREASRSHAYDDARQDSQAAAANFSAAQLATQTLLGGIKKANDGKIRSEEIRQSILVLTRQAYAAARAVAEAVGKIDAFGDKVDARVGKSELVSPRIVAGMAQAKTDAQAALAAILLALQNSVRAYAAASLAHEAASKPFEEGKLLFKILLPGQAAQPDFFDKIASVTSLNLSSSGLQSFATIVQSIKPSGAPGLLNLLAAVKVVTQFRETVQAEAKTAVDLAVGDAQQRLASATEDLALLDAALAAAKAAIE